MLAVREPAVSNLFYPGQREELLSMLEEFLNRAPLYPYIPEAVISPHAGYIYSGPVAAVSYKQLLNLERDKHYDILLIGPSHYVPFNGVSFGYYDYWNTPLGEVRVNKKRIEEFVLANRDFPLTLNTLPHLKEHSLEVQVPFLQVVLDDFSIIPVVYGQVDYRVVKKVIDFFKDEKTVVVISTDLSHYYPDSVAKQIDSNCIEAVENLDTGSLKSCEACGMTGIKAVIEYARENGLKPKVLDYRTSGDTSGDRSAVVGYMSAVFYEKERR